LVALVVLCLSTWSIAEEPTLEWQIVAIRFGGGPVIVVDPNLGSVTPEQLASALDSAAKIALFFVYVSPDGLKDEAFIAEMLQAVVHKHGKGNADPAHGAAQAERAAVRVLLFDDKSYTPSGLLMTDAQMLHQKAEYNYNFNTKFEEFVWITVTDPDSSPPELKRTKANIRPAYAE
jgi:hypothetical protein